MWSRRRWTRPRRRRRSPWATRRSATAWASTSARRRSARYADVIAAREDGRVERPDGRVRTGAVRGGHDGRGAARWPSVAGHDDHRRRRFGGGRHQGGRGRPDDAHLHRRRRVARVPRRAHAAGCRGARQPSPRRADAMRYPVFAANWKMFKTVHEARRLRARVQRVREVADAAWRSSWRRRSRRSPRRPKRRANTDIAIAAQNVYFEREGAFTGEISAAMIARRGRDPRHRRALRAAPAVRRHRRVGQPQGARGGRGRAHADRLHRRDAR